MEFTKDSQLVKSCVLLIVAGVMVFEDVPDIFNLRDVVANVLTG